MWYEKQKDISLLSMGNVAKRRGDCILGSISYRHLPHEKVELQIHFPKSLISCLRL